MLQYNITLKKFLFTLVVLLTAATAYTQVVKREQPVWWFGESAALNFNQYLGTTQMLNSSFSTPTAFHKGKGVKPYFSLLTEYRPNKTWGGMLNVAYDNRGGKFTEVMAPCNCPANLSTNLSYITVEPSLRLAPFSSAFYLFAGPTLSFNIAKSFTYTQEKQSDTRGEWSDIHKTMLSAQAGAGVDIPLSKPSSLSQMTLSPFASFQTNFGRDPRASQSWSVYTVRTGIALKFGTAKKHATLKEPPGTTTTTETVKEKEIQFSVRAPKVFPATRQVKETFPLLNAVFFDEGSSQVPGRYITMNKDQAASFKEAQLQQGQPSDLNNGRSSRQLAVYYSILNIIGDRLRSNPQSGITLVGSADKNPSEGKQMAENIKQYLVNVFGIDGSRIMTEGRDKPVIASEQPGATKELGLLREGDRRVDIMSTSPELLLQVGGTTSIFLKPVQIAVREDLLDSHVIFTAAGANELLNSWSVQLTDQQGNTQTFGPYSNDQASVPGKTILGSNSQGNYKVMMTGQTKTGMQVTKESYVSLMKVAESKSEGLRYSILFGFDKARSIESYESFLTDVVAPLVPNNSTVIIHGYTDIIGDATYNHNLSHERAMGAQRVIQAALARAGKKGVSFETFGFGEDENMSPFENNLPEKRFYNRAVIIDILPGN
jgi:outer membrane protein OmpA-like peptidoglycan-associated protein